MRVTDFDFHLPESLIALKPVIPRDECRLLTLDRDGGTEHRKFLDLHEYLDEGDLLVLNNTRVFPAKLTGKKPTGGKLDILLVKEIENNVWEILSRERYSGSIYISDRLSGKVAEGRVLTFNSTSGNPSAAMKYIWEAGQMPLPPYIKRQPADEDKDWYQTVYAENPGSIAAPTAGIHFTEGLMAGLVKKGVLVRYITLHIGTGTFKPIRAETVENHAMDPEYFEIDATLIDTIQSVKSSGKRVITVGTTTTRAIEGYASGRYTPSSDQSPIPNPPTVGWTEPQSPIIRGTTDIFIYPGYKFRFVDSLITNFHTPRSTPLMLTAAFCGTKKLMEVYGSAMDMGYRFFSYGDAMLIL